MTSPNCDLGRASFNNAANSGSAPIQHDNRREAYATARLTVAFETSAAAATSSVVSASSPRILGIPQ